MRNSDEHIPGLEGPSYSEFRLLAEVEREAHTSQRSLAQRCGLAVSFTNVLLNRLVKKGYVHITHMGWRNWLYTVTPAGVARKTSLVGCYIHRFVDHFRLVREELQNELQCCELHAESRVALCGTDEMAELVYLALRDMGVEHVEVFSLDHDGKGRVLGVQVQFASALRPEAYDRVVLTALGDDKERAKATLYDLGVPPEKVVTLFPVRQKRPEALAVTTSSHPEEA